MAKNYTALLENDPLTASGDTVGAQIDAAFGPEVSKTDAKTNSTMDALNALGSFVTAGKADDQAFIDDLNSRLAKYNIEFTGTMRVFCLDLREEFSKEPDHTFFAYLFSSSPFSRSLSLLFSRPTGKDVGAPARFSNGAALISRAITGMSLSATAVNFAPCLISCVFCFFTFLFLGFLSLPPSVQKKRGKLIFAIFKKNGKKTATPSRASP